MVKDYIDTNDFTKDQLLDMVELSRVAMKGLIKEGGVVPVLLKHKTLGMIFQQVSTRTRMSFETRHDRPRRPRAVLRPRLHPAGRPRVHRGLRPRHGKPRRHPHGPRRPPQGRGRPGEVLRGPRDQRHERVQPPHPGARRPHDHDRESARGQEASRTASSPSSAMPPRCACRSCSSARRWAWTSCSSAPRAIRSPTAPCS